MHTHRNDTIQRLVLSVLLSSGAAACTKNKPAQSQSSSKDSSGMERYEGTYSPATGAYQGSTTTSGPTVPSEHSSSLPDATSGAGPGTSGAYGGSSISTERRTTTTTTTIPSTSTPSETSTSAEGESGAGSLPGETTTTSHDEGGSASNVGATTPDNTGINKRDVTGGEPTPTNQKENPGDREITQRIRASIVGNDDLSFTAKNVKIITTNGYVTLRGPVRSSKEKVTIEASAREVAGADQVNNQLEVTQ